MEKIIIIVLTFFIITTNVKSLNISSENVVLYNLNEDKIIYEKNMNKKTRIASLTKIMTTLVAIENIDNYNKKVTINENMFNGLKEQNAAVIGLKNKQVVTYNDLLYGMFLASAADATRALTINISKSEEEFVKLMNKKAKELNLKNTSFKNTIGLDDNDNYSTVNDVATLLKEALKNDKFKEIFTAKSYKFSDNSIKVSSTLVKTSKKYDYDTSYIIGAKTGYTIDAGRCLASLAIDKKNNIKYLLVTTNANIDTKEAYHILDATIIYKYYFNNYKYYNLINKNDKILTLKTKYSKQQKVNIYSNKTIKLYLKKYNKNKLKLKYKGIDVITPEIKKNQKLGTVNVIYDNKEIDKIDVYMPYNVKFSILKYLKDNIYLVVISIFVLIIMIIFIIKKLY